MFRKLVKSSSLAMGLLAAIFITGLPTGGMSVQAQTSSPAATPASPAPAARPKPTPASTTTPRSRRAANTNRTSRQSTALRVGSRGESVRTLQTFLKKKGFFTGEVNGIFGPRTRTAVIAFQRSRHMRADGIVGARTLAAMR